jgi:hypothetical protein
MTGIVWRAGDEGVKVQQVAREAIAELITHNELKKT